jgi:hypothetical protein
MNRVTSLCALPLIVCAQAASASITSVGPGGLLIPPPPNANFNTGLIESDTEMFIWEEQQNIPLGAVLAVNIDGFPGTYDDTTMGTGGVIRDPVMIDSHFIHLDSLTGTNQSPVAITTTITFDQPIIGIICRDNLLDASDVLGAGTIYPTGVSARDVEWSGGQGVQETFVISPDRLSLTVTLTGGSLGDQARVITGASGGAEPIAHITRYSGARDLPGGVSATATASIYFVNEGLTDEVYVFSLVDPDGVIAFEPPSGFVEVAAGEMVVAQVTMLAPAAGTPGTGLPYRANIIETTTGASATVIGEVRNTDAIYFSTDSGKQIPSPDDGGDADSDGGTTNKTEGQLPPVMLGGRFENDPFRTLIYTETITLAPREVRALVIPVDPGLITLRTGPTGFADLVIEWDQNGDGFPDPGGSITLCAPVPGGACPTDLNGDGTVDGADLGQMLGAWGTCPS